MKGQAFLVLGVEDAQSSESKCMTGGKCIPCMCIEMCLDSEGALPAHSQWTESQIIPRPKESLGHCSEV